MLLSQAGAGLVNGFSKITACVYRPWILDSRVQPVKEAIATATGYSFPSGHVTGATILFGGPIFRRKLPKSLIILLISCIFLVGFSRIYLGVHSILDVICGFAFTLIVLIIFSKLFDKLDEKPNLDIIIACVGIIISILIIIYALTKSYPMDYDTAGKLIVDPAKMMQDTFYSAGMAIATFICWPIERRFIDFSIDGTLETKVTRFMMGFIGLLILQNIILPLLGNGALECLFKNFILICFIMLIYPALIKFFQNRKNSV